MESHFSNIQQFQTGKLENSNPLVQAVNYYPEEYTKWNEKESMAKLVKFRAMMENMYDKNELAKMDLMDFEKHFWNYCVDWELGYSLNSKNCL